MPGISKVERRAARFLARHRSAATVKVAARVAEWVTDSYENLDYEITTNGEQRVLRLLSTLRPRVVFDVGSNRGDWAAEVLSICTSAEVHCFEPQRSTFEALQGRYASEPRVHAVNAGLLDKAGTVNLRQYPSRPVLSTVVDMPAEPPHDIPSFDEPADFMTGDAYLESHGLDGVDLLKIDAEGVDYLALRGFNESLAAGRIRAIQFEYGRASITTGFLLRDYFTLLAEVGYVVGKIYPHEVVFKQYSTRDEDFRGPNYFAVRENDRTVIDLLQRKSP